VDRETRGLLIIGVDRETRGLLIIGVDRETRGLLIIGVDRETRGLLIIVPVSIFVSINTINVVALCTDVRCRKGGMVLQGQDTGLLLVEEDTHMSQGCPH